MAPWGREFEEAENYHADERGHEDMPMPTSANAERDSINRPLASAERAARA